MCNSLKSSIRKSGIIFWKNKGFVHAGSLAYTGLMSAVPLSILIYLIISVDIAKNKRELLRIAQLVPINEALFTSKLLYFSEKMVEAQSIGLFIISALFMSMFFYSELLSGIKSFTTINTSQSHEREECPTTSPEKSGSIWDRLKRLLSGKQPLKILKQKATSNSHFHAVHEWIMGYIPFCVIGLVYSLTFAYLIKLSVWKWTICLLSAFFFAGSILFIRFLCRKEFCFLKKKIVGYGVIFAFVQFMAIYLFFKFWAAYYIKSYGAIYGGLAFVLLFGLWAFISSSAYYLSWSFISVLNEETQESDDNQAQQLPTIANSTT